MVDLQSNLSKKTTLGTYISGHLRQVVFLKGYLQRKFLMWPNKLLTCQNNPLENDEIFFGRIFVTFGPYWGCLWSQKTSGCL